VTILLHYYSFTKTAQSIYSFTISRVVSHDIIELDIIDLIGRLGLESLINQIILSVCDP